MLLKQRAHVPWGNMPKRTGSLVDDASVRGTGANNAAIDMGTASLSALPAMPVLLLLLYVLIAPLFWSQKFKLLMFYYLLFSI